MTLFLDSTPSAVGASRFGRCGHSSFVMNVRWMKYKELDTDEENLMLVTAGGHDRSLMTWKVRKLAPPTIDDPKLLKNEGQLMEAKKVWYYKYTGGEWSGETGIYSKYENIFKGLVGPNDPVTKAKAEKKKAALENNGEGGGAAAGSGGAAGGGGGGVGGGGANLNSQSAVELQSTITQQEAELARQQKMIADLQAQLASR